MIGLDLASTQYCAMNRSLLLCLMLFFFSCTVGPEDKSDLIRDFYMKAKPEGSFDNFEKVIVISEKTTCLNCTNWFATKLADSLEIPETLYVVSGTGAKIDISPYIDEEQDNLILDFNSHFDKTRILDGSGIIYLDDGKVVSTVTDRIYLKEIYGITFDDK